MAKRKQDNISIRVLTDTLDIWCDETLEKQIRDIEGVAGIGMAGRYPNNFWVDVDGRYDINEVAEEIRELANNRAVLSAGNE